jgi:hypothetical protein
MTTRPKIPTAEDIRKIVREEIRLIIREELAARDEQLGLDTPSIERRQAIHDDFAWIRKMRLRADAIAAKVGYVILTTITVGAITIFSLGMKKSGM